MLVINSFSALEFWLKSPASLRDKFSLENRKLVSLPDGYKSEINYNSIQALTADLRLTAPLNILVSTTSQLNSNKYYKSKLFQKNYMQKAFIRLDDSTFIASPELCFIQSAVELSIPTLVETANNLCARYFANPNSQYMQTSRHLITNKKSIIDFLRSTKPIPGVVNARCAIKYVSDNSNSPMESKIAAISRLSFHFGGYNMPPARLNDEILLSKAGGAILKRDNCMCDIVYPELRKVIEYDSNLAHLSPGQHTYDVKRIEALKQSGYDVITLTADNFKTYKSIEDTFIFLRRQLNLRKLSAELRQNYDTRLNALHDIFFKSRPTY